MEIDNNYRMSDGKNNLFPTKVNQIRISPLKTKDELTTRRSLKPFSSSIIQEKKKILTKEDIQKISSKLELIKNKCMNNNRNLKKIDSKKTLNSQFVSDEQLN